MPSARRVADDETPKRQRVRPRAPSRGRGVARYEALLDATEALLRDQSPDDIGLYQIADAANTPTASVYHFFPTKEAAFVALVQRYLQEFPKLVLGPERIAGMRSWQDYMTAEQEMVRGYYERNPPALKLICGGYGGLESRKIDNEFVTRIAQGAYDRYDRIFHMPYLADPVKHFHVSLTIMDAIWSLSYLKHGQITAEYADEALAACIAYCRLFLPERIEVRAEIREYAARGEDVECAIP